MSAPAPPAGPRRRRVREPVPRTAVKVKLSDTERQQLSERADQLAVSIPRLLVESALADPDTGGWVAVREQTLQRRELLTELNELSHLTATIANNVNQLAKVANTSGDLPAAHRLHQMLTEIEAVLEQLRNASRQL
jgi:Bacterial mobilisation protein (MobC)